MDIGHYETELILRETEADVARVYRQAADEVEKKLEEYLRKFKVKDQIKREQLKAGEITKAEYDYWRTGQIAIGKRWTEMKNTLAQDLHNANNLARSIVQGYMPEVYAVNHNYATFQVEKESLVDTSYTLYDRQTVERIIRDQPDLLPAPGQRMKERIAAGKDIAWQRGHIQSVMTQSILQGESIPHIAQRIARTMGESNRKSTVRYARTAATGAQNAGRVDAYKRAEGMGIELEQEWLATLDQRTRDEHRYLDGEHVPVGKPFTVDGYEIRFPGDPAAPGHLIWNCRCTLVPRLKGLDQSDAPRNSKLGNMSYDEWKGEQEEVIKFQREAARAPYTEWDKLQRQQSTDRLWGMGKQQTIDMTQKQKDAIKFYTNGNSDPMNLYLRDKRAFENNYGTYGTFADECVDYTKSASDALKNASLPETVFASRRGGQHVLEKLTGVNLTEDEIDVESIVGKVFSDKGMLSTAADASEAKAYMDMGYSTTFLHIRFNKGAQAVYIDPIGGYETEVLGAPGMEFKILHAEYDNNEILHVFMDSL